MSLIRSTASFAKNHAFGIVIILIWLGMMGRLIEKHHRGSSMASLVAGTPLTVNVYDEWMGIYYQGDKVGYSHRSLSPEGADFRFEEQSYMEVYAQGFPMKLSIRSSGLTGPDLGLKSFTFSLKSGLVETDIQGRVEGEVLKLEMETAGVKSSQALPLREIPTLPGSLSALLRQKTLETGKRFSLPILDPATLSQREMIVEVKGEDFLELDGESIPSRLLTTSYAGISVDLWVDAGGRILKQNTPLGWEMIRETREQALTRGWKSGVKIDMVQNTSVKAEGRPVEDPRSTHFLSVRFPAEALEGLDLNGGRQEFKPGRFPLLYVTQEEPDGLETAALPVQIPEMQPYLEADLFVQSDNPEIREQAERIAGKERNSLRVAKQLLSWVHHNLEKRAVPSLPSALEVLHSRAGDCNEHTVLYVALARSLGLPARTNVGLTLVNGRFYYHAWPEVYVGEWITLDPVFNQIPADATHICLIRGGLEKQVEIVRIIGKLKTLDILAVK